MQPSRGTGSQNQTITHGAKSTPISSDVSWHPSVWFSRCENVFEDAQLQQKCAGTSSTRTTIASTFGDDREQIAGCSVLQRNILAALQRCAND